jgi:hypothetical protein
VDHHRILEIVDHYTLSGGQIPEQAGIGKEQIMGADKKTDRW